MSVIRYTENPSNQKESTNNFQFTVMEWSELCNRITIWKTRYLYKIYVKITTYHFDIQEKSTQIERKQIWPLNSNRWTCYKCLKYQNVANTMTFPFDQIDLLILIKMTDGTEICVLCDRRWKDDIQNRRTLNMFIKKKRQNRCFVG